MRSRRLVSNKANDKRFVPDRRAASKASEVSATWQINLRLRLQDFMNSLNGDRSTRALRSILDEAKYTPYFDNAEIKNIGDFISMAALADPNSLLADLEKLNLAAFRDLRKHLEGAKSSLEGITSQYPLGIDSDTIETAIEYINFAEQMTRPGLGLTGKKGNPDKYIRNFFLASVARLFLSKVPESPSRKKGVILKRCGLIISNMPAPFNLALQKEISGESLRGYLEKQFPPGTAVDVDENGFRYFPTESLHVIRRSPTGDSITERAAKLLDVTICYICPE